jgi:flavorubredoxin
VKEGEMAVSTKYGRVDIPKIGSNEPVFILRAQDKLAEATIGMYKLLATSHGSKLADSLEREMEAFRKWTGAKKLPD